MIFYGFKKPCLWSIFRPFSQFWGAKTFFWKIKLSRTNSYGFLVPCQNLEKTNNKTPRKCLNRRKDERKNGQTKFYRSLQDPKIDNSFRNYAILVESIKATSAKNAVFRFHFWFNEKLKD